MSYRLRDPSSRRGEFTQPMYNVGQAFLTVPVLLIHVTYDNPFCAPLRPKNVDVKSIPYLAAVSRALLGQPAGELLCRAGLRAVEDDHPPVGGLHLVHEAPVFNGGCQIIHFDFTFSISRRPLPSSAFVKIGLGGLYVK